MLVSPEGSPAHALAGSALAAARGVPVLIASAGSVPAETVAARIAQSVPQVSGQASWGTVDSAAVNRSSLTSSSTIRCCRYAS